MTPIQFDPRNARRHPDQNKALIRQSLEEVGAFRSIAVDGEDIIRAGNGVYEQAVALGLKVRIVEAAPDELIAVKRPDLVGELAERAAILDNRAGETSTWDEAVLAYLKENQPDVVEGLWSEDEWKAILANLEEETQDDRSGQAESADAGDLLDAAQQLQVKWGTAPGQLWSCGRHLVACGDATDAGLVRRLFSDRPADMMWTDPPYGVDYVGKTKDALTIENDGAKDLDELLRLAWAAVDPVLRVGAPFYIAHPAGILSLVFGKSVIDAGWHFHETLVWVKDSMVLGHSDYHYKHEPIIYGWKGANRPWYAGRDQVTTFEVPRPKRSELHPTMKPIELIELQMANSSTKGDLVVDLFLGSGTTLIASERLGRTCRGTEKDPKYVAVVLERYLQFTGQTPVLNDEKTRLLSGAGLESGL